MKNLNRAFYQLVSIVFHPLLIFLYLLFIMSAINPYDFIAFQGENRFLLYFQIIISSLLLPAIAIVMMYSLGLVSSVELGDSKERMFPFIAAAVFYLWLFANFIYNPNIPKMLNIILFAAILGLFFSMVINLFIRLSIHCLGMGSLLGALVLIYFDWITLFSRDLFWGAESMVYLIVLSIICAGLVGTARLQLGVHTVREVYVGYVVGLICPFLSFFLIDWLFYG